MDTNTHSQTLGLREKAHVGGFHQVRTLRAWGTSRKRGKRNVGARGFVDTRKSQPAESTKQGSSGLTKTEAASPRSVLVFFVCYGC